MTRFSRRSSEKTEPLALARLTVWAGDFDVRNRLLERTVWGSISWIRPRYSEVGRRPSRFLSGKQKSHVKRGLRRWS